MKKLFALILSTALAFGPGLAYASPGTIVKGDVFDGFENILVNPSLERSTCTNGWTVAPTSACDGTNLAPGQGRQSVQLTLSTSSGSLFYQDVTPIHQFGSTNMEAGLWVKTSTTGLQVCPRSGGTVQTAQCVSVPATGTWQPVSANMIGPSSGTVGVALYAPSSIASGTVNVDGAYVGRARNLSQVSQSQIYGSAAWAGISTCTWSTTSTTYANFAAVAGCPTPTVTANAQAPATKIPGVTFASLPPGDYFLVANGFLGPSATNAAFFRFTDGTNSTPGVQYFSNGGQFNGPALMGHLTYTTAQSNVTIQVQGQTSASANAVSITNNSTQAGFELLVYYFPSQSQQALRADQTPASWSGTTTLSGTLTSTSTAGADPGSVTGSVTTTASRNMTCVAATSLDGITCNLPRLGNYQVCYGGTLFQATAGANTNAKLSDGSNADITGYQLVSIAAAGGTGSFGQCANYTATAATVTFKVRGYVSAGTGTFSPSTFSVTELDAPMPAPYLVGSVTSNTQGQERVERARMNSNCTVSKQSGSWISGMSGTGASTGCTVTIASGMFSDAPSCTFSAVIGGNFGCNNSGSSTTTSMGPIYCRNLGTAAGTDAAFDIICMGPR